MQCKNHPDVEAVARCVGCAEPFCGNCLVEIQGQKYCASCKTLAVKGPLAAAVEPTIPCKNADQALMLAIIGIFCFGIILEPIAINKALKARGEIRLNPLLKGAGKALAALIIGIVGTVLWVLGVFLRFSAIAHQR